MANKGKNNLVNLEQIKELCEQKNLSFAELGRTIGITCRDSITKRINNQYQISADELFLIADSLNVPVEELRIA